MGRCRSPVDDGGHLDTGIFGTRYIVDALASIGRIDVATGVLGQESYPGFGFELAHGATTPWEQWTYAAGMLTHDHAMFGGINTSLYTQLAGITPSSPGYVEGFTPFWDGLFASAADGVTNEHEVRGAMYQRCL